MKMEIALVAILWIASLAGVYVGKDIIDANRAPKTEKTEVYTTVTVDVTAKSEMRNFTVQETSVYNDADRALILAMTNQTAYSNLINAALTNSNRTNSYTNTTNY